MTAPDTVFNKGMRPVLVGPPEDVLRRLKCCYPKSWTKVCIGETDRVVSITEYINQKKWDEVDGILREILRKHNLPMYQRSPERLEMYIEQTVAKIFDAVGDDLEYSKLLWGETRIPKPTRHIPEGGN